MLTNRLGLPEGVARAVANDPYSKGASDISVTQLITPPYQRKLREENEPQEDVSDRIWSLLGQATHTILERAYPEAIRKGDSALSIAELYEKQGYLVEERLYMPWHSWLVSGAFDVYERGTMFDYKVTSVWSVKGETKIEWEQQLNLLRLLAYESGLPPPEKLTIIAILRDWSKLKARIDGHYPQAQVVPVDIPVWSLSEARDYLDERMSAHFEQPLVPCSDTERWKDEDVWALMKEGRKSAVKLFDTKSVAEDFLDEIKPADKKLHYIDLRPGTHKRCMDYCNVAHACPTWKGEVAF